MGRSLHLLCVWLKAPHTLTFKAPLLPVRPANHSVQVLMSVYVLTGHTCRCAIDQNETVFIHVVPH